jgi:hypothetical protein
VGVGKFHFIHVDTGVDTPLETGKLVYA